MSLCCGKRKTGYKATIITILLGLTAGISCSFLTARTIRTQRSPSSTLPARNPQPHRTDLKSAIEQIRINQAQPDRKTGSIHGRITTPDGEPVRNVCVRAAPKLEYPELESDNVTDENVAFVVHEYLTSSTFMRETVTDANGMYVIKDLAFEHYHLAAFLDGYALNIKSCEYGEDLFTPGTEVNFKAKPVIGIEVSILMPDGTEAESGFLFWQEYDPDSDDNQSFGDLEFADIDIDVIEDPFGDSVEDLLGDSDDDPFASAEHYADKWTPDKRSVRREPGSYRILAREDRYGVISSAQQTVTLTDKQPKVNMTFQLTNSPAVKGRLIISNAIPPGTPGGLMPQILRVYAHRMTNSTVPSIADLRLSSHHCAVDMNRKTTAHYRLAGLTPGTYFIGAVQDLWDKRCRETTRHIAASGMVTLSVKPEILDLHVPFPDQSKCFSISVFGPDNQQLSAVHLMHDGVRRMEPASWGRNPDGTWWIYNPGFYETLYPAQVHHVVVTSPVYGKKIVAFEPDSPQNATVTFGEPSTLQLRFPDISKEDNKIRHLFQIHEHESKAVLESARFFYNSTNSFTTLSSGEYDIKILRARSSLLPVYSETITLHKGENTITLQPPEFYSLTVLADQDHDDELLILDAKTMRRIDMVELEGPERQAVVHALPQGKYVLRMSRNNSLSSMAVTVPCTGPVKFEAPPSNALKVTIQNESGALAGSGFRQDDIIVAINGIPFRKITSITGLLHAFSGLTQTTATVLRQNTLVDLDVDMSRIRQDSFDGRLTDTTVVWRH